MMTLKVNGQDHQIDAEPDTPLLYILRDDIKLNAAKFGCGLGQCGSCTVIVDGKAAAQCGYCIAGMMMRAQALLQRNSRPTDEEIRSELEPHLCRCGTHMRILRAVHRAIRLINTADASSATQGSAR